MIKRDIYLQKIIDRMNNGMIKVITVYEDTENLIYYLKFFINICVLKKSFNNGIITYKKFH